MPDGPETSGAPPEVVMPDGKPSIKVRRVPVVRLTSEMRPLFGVFVPDSVTRSAALPAVTILAGLVKPVVKTDVPCARAAAAAPSKIVSPSMSPKVIVFSIVDCLVIKFIVRSPDKICLHLIARHRR